MSNSNIEIALSQIARQRDMLLKSYWLFVDQHIRSDKWDDLFRQHLDQYYPSKPKCVEFDPCGRLDVDRFGFYKIVGKKGTFRALIDYPYVFDQDLLIDKSRGSQSNDLYGVRDKVIFKNITSARNNKRTNFPRSIWQREEVSWNTYYEGLLILSRIYDEMSLVVKLEYMGKEIHEYRVPIAWEFLETPDGESFKYKGKVDKSRVLPNNLDRTYENALSHILRDIFTRHKLTKKKLDEYLDEYISVPRNLYSFNSKSKPNIKTSILNSIFNWNINFDNFIRGIRIMKYSGITIEIVAKRNDKSGKKIAQTSVSIGL